jgi:hypothetical protein
VELTDEVQRALMAAAFELFLSRAVNATTNQAKLREKIERAPIGQYSVRASCPAYAVIDVEGKPMRASVPFALGKKTAEIRTQLVERLGYVPPGTYVRFTWEFERNAMGKPLDKIGQVEIFFKWGGEVPKKE